jgi:hypothetical protein
MSDLVEFNSLSIVSQSHTSRDWVEIVYNFLVEHGLEDDLKPAARMDEDPSPRDLDAVKSTDGRSSPTLEQIFFGDDHEDDAVSELRGVDDPPFASDSKSKTSAVSRGSVLSFSRQQWLNMKPLLTFGVWGEDNESEPWFKFVQQARSSIEEVTKSIDAIGGAVYFEV